MTKDLLQKTATESKDAWSGIAKDLEAMRKQLDVTEQMRNQINSECRLLEREVLGDRPTRHEEFTAELERDHTPVLCIPLTTMHRMQTPRLVSIYRKVGDRLHVQQFYGLLQTPVGEYAVMEDLERQKDVFTVKEAIVQNAFITTTPLLKLRLCYEIASTLASMHSMKLLVKIICDEYIYLRFSGTEILPIFTNLENARDVLPTI